MSFIVQSSCVTGEISIGPQKKYISAFLLQNSKSLLKTCHIAVRIFYFPFDLYQRYMIAAVKDLSEEPTGNQDRANLVANYPEACNLIFENGLLSQCRINSLNSPVIHNIKNKMDFIEKWCHRHEETGIIIFNIILSVVV